MSLQDDRTGIPSARLMNRLVEWSRRSFRLALGVGLRMQHTPAGRALALDGPDRSFPARLITGEGSGPFVFRRVRRKAGAWVDVVARDDRAVAYQANSLTVDIPRVVTLRNVGLPAEYRFWLPRDEASSGGGMETSPCFPCDIPRVDLYLTLLRGGFYASGTPDQDLEPLEIPLAYLTTHSYFTVANPDPIIGGRVPVSEATPVWASTCVQIPSLQTVVAEDGSSTVETTSTYYRLWIYCHPVDGVMVEGWKYTDADSDCDDTAPETFLLFPSLTFTLLATCAASCIPLKLYLSSLLGETVLATAPGDLEITTTIDFRPIVTRPECEGISEPVVGATVTIQRHGSLSPEATGTTGSDGRPTTTEGRLTVTRAGRYTVRATLGDCTVESEIIAAECDEEIDVPLILCCPFVRITLTGLYADVEGTVIPLDGAIVTGLTADPLTADVDGLIETIVPGDRLFAFTPSPGDCTIFQAMIQINAPGSWLNRCVTIDLTCGSSAEAPDLAAIQLLNLGTPEDVARYHLTGSDDPMAPLDWLCPDLGCTHPGWPDRGLASAVLLILLGYLDAQWEDESMGGTVWYSLVPPGLLAAIDFDLDLGLLAAAVPGHLSPNGTARRLEYYASGTGIWRDPTGSPTATPYTKWEAWLAEKPGSPGILRLRIRLESATYDPAHPELAVSTAVIPPDRPLNPDSGGGSSSMDILLDIPGSLCLPVAIDQDHEDSSEAGGLGYRWAITITEGNP